MQSMETEPSIPSFVFVDGRKYVLAETEELPEPEMLAKLTPPPRNVSASVRWRLYLRHESELLALALLLGLYSSVGMLLILGEDDFVKGLIIAMAAPTLPYVYVFTTRIYSEIRETLNMLQLLQDGLAGTGRFAGMCSTKKKVDNKPEMQLKYQFTTQEGNTYNASFCMVNVKKIMELSTESLKLIFYDPVKPSRNVLFDTLPKGIEFDDLDGIFRTHSSFLITQILWLCFCVAVFPVFFAVIVFGC